MRSARGFPKPIVQGADIFVGLMTMELALRPQPGGKFMPYSIGRASCSDSIPAPGTFVEIIHDVPELRIRYVWNREAFYALDPIQRNLRILAGLA